MHETKTPRPWTETDSHDYGTLKNAASTCTHLRTEMRPGPGRWNRPCFYASNSLTYDMPYLQKRYIYRHVLYFLTGRRQFPTEISHELTVVDVLVFFTAAVVYMCKISLQEDGAIHLINTRCCCRHLPRIFCCWPDLLDCHRSLRRSLGGFLRVFFPSSCPFLGLDYPGNRNGNGNVNISGNVNVINSVSC